MLFLPHAKIEQLEAETNLDTLVKGWKLVAKKPKLKLFVQANLLEDFSNSIWVSSVILVFVTEVLKQTESYWGYSNTAYSLGIILGGIIVYKLSEKFLAHKWKSIFFPLLAMAVSYTHLDVYKRQVFKEAHVKHFIRFIQNQSLNVIEFKSLTFDKVKETTWCPYNDVGTWTEGLHLFLSLIHI